MKNVPSYNYIKELLIEYIYIYMMMTNPHSQSDQGLPLALGLQGLPHYSFLALRLVRPVIPSHGVHWSDQVVAITAWSD